MILNLQGSVGANGLNNAPDVNAVQMHLVKLGYSWVSIDGLIGPQTINAIKLFQAICRGYHRVQGTGVDGRIDVNGFTHQWLQASNAPNWKKMSEGSDADGYENYEIKDENDNHDYGTSWLEQVIKSAGASYRDNYLNQNSNAALITINDTSLPEGGNTPDHNGHETGISCDLRLPKIDGTAGGITWNSATYDQNAMRASLQAFWQNSLVTRIFFNDTTLISEGLCESEVGHDDHAHIEIIPPPRISLSSISTNKKRLHSQLLEGERILLMTARGEWYLFFNERKPIIGGKAIQKLRAAMWIILPESLHLGLDKQTKDQILTSLDLNGIIFDFHLHAAIFTFQSLYQNKYNLGNPDGIVGSKTIDAIDKELQAIRYYKYDPENNTAKTIHNAQMGSHVGKYTVVDDAIAYVYSEPLDNDELRIVELQRNSRVLIIQIMPAANGWSYVELDDGSRGYVKTSSLWIESRMPEPFAKLYKIQDGDTLETIVRREYGGAISNPNDLRFYGNVLLYINNYEGTRKKKREALDQNTGKYTVANDVDAAIYLDKDEDSWDIVDIWETIEQLREVVPYHDRGWQPLESELNTRYGGWKVWQRVIIVTDSNIWLPSKEYADSLLTLVDTGSLTGGAVGDVRKAVNNIQESLKEKAKALYDSFSSELNDHWGIGWGVKLEAIVGATFGIPLGLDFDGKYYFWRESATTFKLLRRGVIGGGLDTGIGAGAYIGLGKRPDFTQGKKDTAKRIGFGAEIGANFRTGRQFTILQEFTFNIDEDLALATMFYTLLKPGVLNAGILGSLLSSTFEFFNIDPNNYMTRLGVKAGTYIDGVAVASGGLRYGNDNEISTWQNNDKNTSFTKGDGFIGHYLAHFSTASLSVQGRGEFAAGFEYKVQLTDGETNYYIDETSGNRIPLNTELSFYLEASAQGAVSAKIILPLVNLMSELGGGVKVTLKYQFDPEEFASENSTRSYQDFLITPYLQTGEWDVHEGPASMVEFSFSLKSLAKVPDAFDFESLKTHLEDLIPDSKEDLIRMLERSKIELRLGYDLFLGALTKMRTFRDRIKSLNVLIDKNNPQQSVMFAGYIDIGYVPPKEIMTQILTSIVDLIDDQDAQTRLVAAVRQLFKYITTGAIPEDIPFDFDNLIKRIADNLDFPSIRIQVELGFAYGVALKAAAGAKVRIRVFAGGAVIVKDQMKLSDFIYLLLPAILDKNDPLLKLNSGEVANDQDLINRYRGPITKHLFSVAPKPFE